MDRALDEIVAERHVSLRWRWTVQPCLGTVLRDRLANILHREAVDLADVVVDVEMIAMNSLVTA
jgi:hypothetical protein